MNPFILTIGWPSHTVNVWWQQSGLHLGNPRVKSDTTHVQAVLVIGDEQFLEIFFIYRIFRSWADIPSQIHILSWMKARLIAREAPILHLELTDCDSLAFSQAKNIFGSKGKIISALLDLCRRGRDKILEWSTSITCCYPTYIYILLLWKYAF